MRRSDRQGQLWDVARPAEGGFDPARLDVPSTARRYLEHAIKPGTPLAAAVRLTMRGDIKLRKWLPFKAEQVISQDRGFVWSATVRTGPAWITGSDSLVDGRALMSWRMLGLIPVLVSSGPDIDRSAAGRFAAESIWLPSLLCSDRVTWGTSDSESAVVSLPVASGQIDVRLSIGEAGEVKSVSLKRWGETDSSKGYGLVEFGALAEGEKSFGGYTIPSRLRAGWYFDDERFEQEGEFFHCAIEAATFK